MTSVFIKKNSMKKGWIIIEITTEIKCKRYYNKRNNLDKKCKKNVIPQTCF